MLRLNQLFFLFSLAFLFSNKSWAQEKPEPVHHETHYHFSGFAGFTSDYKGRNGYKLGIEYEYRLNDYFGVGGTFDFTGADFQIFGLSGGITAYPFRIPLIVALAAGAKNSDNHWKYFTRGLLAYDFHLDNISIGPVFMYDAFPNEKDIITAGLGIGFGF